ncbi:hypothetical protein DFH09DRAFT_1115338 [Mycena vulgaris]|nr:hypothetical protein DFH09DRAFT_1115338 [Mycena vulgaris]
MSTASGEVVEMSSSDPALAARIVGDTYSPDMLSDHKGPYFSHEKAKLAQRPYLIAPHELYAKLTESTLLLTQISLAKYVMKNPRFLDAKIYHVNVDKLTILDKGNGKTWDLPVPGLPEKVQTPTTPRTRRARDPAVDSSFDNLSASRKGRST